MKNKLLCFLILSICFLVFFITSSQINLLTISSGLNDVFILSTSGFDEIPIGLAIFMELFCSIHMSVFVLIPLSKILFNDNNKSAFWIMFGIRAGLLFIINFITPFIAIIDFFAVFVGAFLVVPVAAIRNKKELDPRSNQVVGDMEDELTDLELKEKLKKEGFDDKDLLMDYLVRHYADINRAYYIGDFDKLQRLCDDDIYISYKTKYDFLSKDNYKPMIDDVDFYDVKITSFRKTNDEAFVELFVKYKCLEYVVDKYDLLISGSKTSHKDYCKKIEFYTKYFDDTKLECPNCKINVYNTMDKCHNCGTELNFDNEWILINEEEIYE